MINYEFSLYTFEYFLMILVRAASFVFIAPFFGMSNTPNRVKIGFSAFLAIILYHTVLPKEMLEYSGILEFTIIVLREGITGLLIGLAMANIYDPMTRTQSGLTGSLYNYFILMLLVVTDMHHYILQALIDTYQVIPMNGAAFDWNHLMGTMTMYITDLMVIGFRIILPIFATSMILNCILGIMAKVAPQMNMFAVGMQLKILLGLSIMFVTIILLPDIANFIFREMKKMMVSVIEGMY